jgi:hypothetical protein
MARHINADMQYATWFAELNWMSYEGRSVTRWGSADNQDSGSVHQPSSLRLAYNPSQNVTTSIWHLMMRKFRAVMGYRAIVLRAHFWFRHGTSAGSQSFNMQCHRFLKAAGYPEFDDCGMIYRDQSEGLRWFAEAYGAQIGEDLSSLPIATVTWVNDRNAGQFFDDPLDLTDYFATQLLEAEDLYFELWQNNTNEDLFLGTSVLTERPKFEVFFVYPVEMFPESATESGKIDYSRLLDTDNEPISLGAYQTGQTGAGHLFFLANFSRETLAHIEVWDDYPEWTTPVAGGGNGGSGDLAYVEVFESCVSQRWEIKFSNATDFEVKATLFLDNLESLHSQYDADPDWTHDTATDWTSPDGSVTLPAAAWSGTPQADDVFVFFTRGQTTPSSWPADSNDQVQITQDDGGSPDAAGWRPINGRRTESTGSVTIDAATKTINVKRIVPTDWPVGTPVYIANADDIDEGTIKSVTATTVEIENLSVSGNSYAAGAIVATTLPIRSLAAAKWAELTDDSGVFQANAKRLYIAGADTYGFTGGATVFVQSNAVPDNYELGVINLITSTYVELQADMVNDYEPGSMVIQRETGEAKFWLRVVADPAAAEGLREFRLNVIA